MECIREKDKAKMGCENERKNYIYYMNIYNFMLFLNVSKYGNIYKTVFIFFYYRKQLSSIFTVLCNIMCDNNIEYVPKEKVDERQLDISENKCTFELEFNDEDDDYAMGSDACTESCTDTDTEDYGFMREVRSRSDTASSSPEKRKKVTFNNKMYVVWIPERCEYGNLLRELWYTSFDYRIFSQTYRMEMFLESIGN